MIRLIGLFVVFVAGGFMMMGRMNAERREKWTFIVLTCIGLALWASLLLHRPLDLNKAIGWMIDRLANL
ncbi:hypothetical protein [Paenibacillus glycinis]|uniref:Uncharacterized protein n=1 Tax=Paenibacillus glycinis TaxID=2697035 RepID=A0ABW9XQ83_9BACL|nr:hypothetical protein [Paenibacillus glycinis]NBD24785.1 hypothetical protein [Paenibacillus glycinis]